MKNTLLAFAIVLFSNSSHLNAQCSDHLQLDGGSEYLHTPFENYTFNHLTMECWINHADYTSNVHYISLYKNIYAVIGNWSGTPNYTTWLDGVNPISITAPTSVPVNTWQHIAFVYDGATQFFYVNGILVASQASTGAINNTTSFNSGLVIGARYDQSSQFMTGMINDIRIWNVARTQVEIQSAMNSTLSGSEPGLIAYYDFNSGFGGSTVYDLTANGNDLTLMNMDPATDWLEGNDNVAPVADLVSLPDVNADCEVTALTVPTATDNCVGLINGVSDAILPITAQGTTVVTWTYDDGNGNTSTQTQNIVITCSASIDENVAQPFEVYPNPFHDKFQLTSDFDLTLSISDQYGKIVANIELKANEAREINMELFSAGIYMIRSLNDGTSSAYRIVKY
jgi:hypothetical protein